MIKCAGLLYDFFKNKPNFKEYENTALVIKLYPILGVMLSLLRELLDLGLLNIIWRGCSY